MLESQSYSGHSFPYKSLKKMVTSDFSLEDENKFQSKLEEEFLKVFDYISTLEEDLRARVNVPLSFESYEKLRNELYEFSSFIKANILAVKRIIERHDKFTGFKLMSVYKDRLKEKASNLEEVLQLIHTMRYERLDLEAYPVNISKFWIPQENLVDIKLEIMRHLEKVQSDEHDSNGEYSYISTVYLDNTEFSLYSSFIDKEPYGFFIRLRWYGTKSETVNCEILQSMDAENTKPKINSIRIPKNLILSFINGDDIWQLIKDQENQYEIYADIQEKIQRYRLRPVVRTFFKRQVFSSPSVQGLKVSLDSNIVMIKECSNFDFEADHFPLKSWARSDVGYDWPFRNLSASEIIRFPFSTLKIQKDENPRSSPPNAEWLETLLSGSKIEKMERFTKFIHGCALLYPSKKNNPNWIPNAFSYSLYDGNEAIPRNQFSNEFLRGAEESEIAFNTTPLVDEKYKLAIPVRIEPKVFFANERTFLSWVQFAIFLGGVGTAMIGLGNTHAYLCGVMLVGVAAIFSFYALYLFHDRSVRLKVKDVGPYDNIVGPLILTSIFILVMILSFVFKFPIKKNNMKVK